MHIILNQVLILGHTRPAYCMVVHHLHQILMIRQIRALSPLPPVVPRLCQPKLPLNVHRIENTQLPLNLKLFMHAKILLVCRVLMAGLEGQTITRPAPRTPTHCAQCTASTVVPCMFLPNVHKSMWQKGSFHLGSRQVVPSHTSSKRNCPDRQTGSAPGLTRPFWCCETSTTDAQYLADAQSTARQVENYT